MSERTSAMIQRAQRFLTRRDYAAVAATLRDAEIQALEVESGLEQMHRMLKDQTEKHEQHAARAAGGDHG